MRLYNTEISTERNNEGKDGMFLSQFNADIYRTLLFLVGSTAYLSDLRSTVSTDERKRDNEGRKDWVLPSRVRKRTIANVAWD